MCAQRFRGKFAVLLAVWGGEFRGMAGLGCFPSEFRANSERTPSSAQILGEFRANSGQIPNKHPKPTISVQRISLVG